jgi:peptide/nickel transport system permease protein
VKNTGPLRKVLRNPLGVAVVAYLFIILILALFGSSFSHWDPNKPDVFSVLQGPSAKHWFGTDSAGRDVYTRLLVGSRATLIAAALVVATALLIGVPVGMFAGYYGGALDGTASWASNMLMSLPVMIILLSARTVIGSSIYSSMFIVGVLVAPGFFRLTRTAVMAVRNELYVDAARVSGLSDIRIMSKHILTVVRAPIIIQTSMIAGIAISFQSSLEFLGLGDSSLVSWGVMLNDGFRNIFMKPILLFWPALAISLTIASFVLFGNAFRDALEDSKKVKAKKSDPTIVISETPAASDESHHLLSVTHLGIGYPLADGGLKKVVNEISFFVDKGEVLGIVGESGSGKTQTAFSILGLLPESAIITSGRVNFNGESLLSPEKGKISEKAMREFRGKKIAYIPQEPMSNLDPNFKIGFQLVRPMIKVLGLSKADAVAKAHSLLKTVGIENTERIFNAYPHEISGGMAQRVLIAGAVSCDPDLLMADEPTTALDVTIQAEVLDLLRDLQGKFGMGIILVTHNFGVVADLCDRVVVMQNGSVVESGDVRTILKAPKEPYTQELLSSMLVDKTPMTLLTSGKGK